MFGYVKADKAELKVRDYDVYKAVYCSLCRELGRSFGLASRFFLSYDFTFLALLRMSLAPECTGFQKGRCPFNPFHRCNYCKDSSPELTLSAASAVFLFYHKLRDSLHDKGFWKKIAAVFLYPVVALAHNKAKRLFPELDMKISRAMKEQSLLESEACTSIDRAADPTAQMLAAICSFDVQEEEQHRILERLGYCMGRWVYLMDAADDLEKDRASGDYNVLLSQESHAPEEVRRILNLTAAEAVNAYSLLKPLRFDDILSNILYDGMTGEMNRVLLEQGMKA